MTALDLFSGACGGWSVGLHENGIETVAACEIDPWRREVFGRNFPGARLYDDVRSLTAARLLDDLGRLPDIIVGSPPCQDASVANTSGKGVDGERTGLFFEAVRLVREVRPVWCCFENVPGLRARGYDRVHDALEAAGYEVRPFVVGAWHAGAPHRRNRVWIAAVAKGNGCGPRRAGRFDPGDTGQPEQTLHHANAALVQRPQVARDQPDGFAAGHAAHAHETGQREHGRPEPVPAQQPAAQRAGDDADASGADATGRSSDGGRSGWQGVLAGWQDWNGGPPDLGRVDDGLPKGMARKMLSAYGDAVVPQVTGAVIRAILTASEVTK